MFFVLFMDVVYFFKEKYHREAAGFFIGQGVAAKRYFGGMLMKGDLLNCGHFGVITIIMFSYQN